MSSSENTKVYKYRWIILALFYLMCVTNFMQELQFVIMADVVIRYYNVDVTVVHGIGLIFFVVYVTFFMPASFLIEKYNLRFIALLSTSLTFFGTVAKLFSTGVGGLYFIIVGQIFCGIGQIFMASVPTKLVMTWFGPDEVSTACSLTLFGDFLGSALGALIPALAVGRNQTNESTQADLMTMLICNSIAVGTVDVLVYFFFRERPELPPSQSQLLLLSKEKEKHFIQNMKKAFQNKDFIKVLLVFGPFIGISTSFTIVINTIYINYFPEGQMDIGIIVVITIFVGGCIGNVIIGFILDRTHQFRIVGFLLMFAATIAFVLKIYTILIQNRLATFFTIPIFGFFAVSTMVVSYEYALEATYPIPESVSCSVLNGWCDFCVVMAIITIDSLMNTFGDLYCFIIITIALCCCSFGVFTISSNLRRYEANQAKPGSSDNTNSISMSMK